MGKKSDLRRRNCSKNQILVLFLCCFLFCGGCVLVGGSSSDHSSTTQTPTTTLLSLNNKPNNKLQQQQQKAKKTKATEKLMSSSSTTMTASEKDTTAAATIVARKTTTAVPALISPYLTKRYAGTLTATIAVQPDAAAAAAAASADSQQQQHKLPDLHLHRDPIYMWSSLVAGAGSGALASILCAPLDLIRTRLQVWGEVVGGGAGGLSIVPNMVRDIIKKDGIAGCFRGLGATLLTVPAFWGVYFPLYDYLKRHWTIQNPDTNPTWIHMSSAVSAGIVSDILCNPMFVVRTRLQTESLHMLMEGGSIQKKTVIETAKALYLEGGLPSFWRGMTANILGLSHVAVQFPVYESLKKKLRKQRNDDMAASGSNSTRPQHHNSAWDLLAASAFSKLTACVITYPHEVVRSRMMDARAGAARLGFINTCKRIYATEGMAGFYAGLPITMIRVLPNTCITFLTYELFLQWARTQIEDHRRQTRK